MTAQILLGIVFLAVACSPAAPSSEGTPTPEGDGSPAEQEEAPVGQEDTLAAVPRDPRGPLCADCVALGGETGDFTGGGVRLADACPPYSLVNADSELVLESGLSAAAAIAFVERERHIPAAWTPTGQPNNPTDVEREVSGFAPQTSLTLALEVTGVLRLEWLPDPAERPASAKAACDGFALSANVSIATADGALIGTFGGVTVHVYSESEAKLHATADISNFIGSLELDPGPDEGLGASLHAHFDADQARGSLVPYVQLSRDEVPPYSYSMYQPLHARWPGNDACNDHSFPYAGSEGATRVEPVIAALSVNSPYLGEYRDPQNPFDVWELGEVPPELTELSLDVGEPSNVCQGREVSGYPRAPGQEFQLELPARLHSDDGRYDLSLPLSVTARRLPDGTTNADARFYSRAMPVAEFQARFGIDGLDLGEAECAALSLEHAASSQGQVSSLLMVEAGPCSPLDSNGDMLDRRRVEVLGH